MLIHFIGKQYTPGERVFKCKQCGINLMRIQIYLGIHNGAGEFIFILCRQSARELPGEVQGLIACKHSMHPLAFRLRLFGVAESILFLTPAFNPGMFQSDSGDINLMQIHEFCLLHFHEVHFVLLDSLWSVICNFWVVGHGLYQTSAGHRLQPDAMMVMV